MLQIFRYPWLNRGIRKDFEKILYIVNQESKFRNYSDDSDSKNPTVSDVVQRRRFKKFKDQDAEIIFDDIDSMLNQKQERRRNRIQFDQPPPSSEFRRGKQGVFDLEEMCDLLRQENFKDIVVIKVPEALKYCDYKIICTATSQRHLRVFADTLNKIYKLKKNPNDPPLDLTTDQSNDWRLIDLRNLIVHIFMQKTRDHYDIETLWAVGEEFDDKCRKPQADIVEQILQKHFGGETRTAIIE